MSTVQSRIVESSVTVAVRKFRCMDFDLRILVHEDATIVSMARSRTLVSWVTWLLTLFSLVGGGVHGLPPVASSGAYSRATTGDEYILGVGKSDITGPVVEINFMGYASLAQIGSGLRQRVYSRAFLVGEVNDPASRFVYLILDTAAGDTAVRNGILEALAAKGGDYASLYGQHNVAVTGTHAHSGPGAWLNYLLPQITSLGFNKPSYQAIVDGAVDSIVQAHESAALGRLSAGTIDLVDGNANRSPYAYLANSDAERARYSYDTDKTMTVLRFTHDTNSGSKDIGILSWYAVHGTSMLENNTLVTGDNKGIAAWMFEKQMVASQPGFVAGFSQANVGDTTPNINGAYCESGSQQGKPCDFTTSLCDGSNEACHGRGPYYGRNDYGTASAYEMGRRQYQAAYTLFQNSSSSAFTPISGSMVKSLHQFVDFSAYRFTLPNGTAARTCPGALGYGFAAGTTDGPGAFDFKQGQGSDPHANPLWVIVSDALHVADDTQKACQAPKPILLDTGETSTPYAWSPNIVDIQQLRVGQFFIIVSPGEATTMSGRRWREAVHSKAPSILSDLGSSEPIVVLGGPANTYTHYIATPEEYGIQRYEGASTLFGPNTVNAYIDLTLKTLPYLSSTPPSTPLDPGPSPPINTNNSLSFITPVVLDSPPLFRSFGDIVTDVSKTYHASDTISAKFIGANPRNNFRLQQTFAAVEQLGTDGKTWTQIRNDADWSLVYQWTRTNAVLGTSEVTISWETKWETGAWQSPAVARRDAEAALQGIYRLKYYGDAKSIDGSIHAFEGTSGQFQIV
ncbi:Hypothetical protein R9X50_00159700 [Acrodontium crateriforme]|uniref:Neutral ceramidase n=1 Tax=Acrodontium crateriforme TaxID=150365 RepID=A0AAQ3M5G5_9PEZI|nr:Hypothetical protein R9X50_00159700 [Acrodontium crateriforme]